MPTAERDARSSLDEHAVPSRTDSLASMGTEWPRRQQQKSHDSSLPPLAHVHPDAAHTMAHLDEWVPLEDDLLQGLFIGWDAEARNDLQMYSTNTGTTSSSSV